MNESPYSIKENMKITIAQFEGIDNTPALPLAAGLIVATAKSHTAIKKKVSFDIIVPRTPISAAVAELVKSQLIGFSLYPFEKNRGIFVLQLQRFHPSMEKRFEQNS